MHITTPDSIDLASWLINARDKAWEWILFPKDQTPYCCLSTMPFSITLRSHSSLELLNTVWISIVWQSFGYFRIEFRHSQFGSCLHEKLHFNNISYFLHYFSFNYSCDLIIMFCKEKLNLECVRLSSTFQLFLLLNLNNISLSHLIKETTNTLFYLWKNVV